MDMLRLGINIDIRDEGYAIITLDTYSNDSTKYATGR
jgi:hypothetical protein